MSNLVGALAASYAKPGDVLFYQEEVASDLYFLVTGKVNLFATFSVSRTRFPLHFPGVMPLLLWVRSARLTRKGDPFCGCGRTTAGKTLNGCMLSSTSSTYKSDHPLIVMYVLHEMLYVANASAITMPNFWPHFLRDLFVVP